MLARMYKRRLPIFRDGITPRRAQSSTVDLGTRSKAATSAAVRTSAAVNGRSRARVKGPVDTGLAAIASKTSKVSIKLQRCPRESRLASQARLRRESHKVLDHRVRRQRPRLVVVAGIVLDTADYGRPSIPAGSGPRWRSEPLANLSDGRGHPPGL
jgi:hypothetical protein